MVTRKDGTPVLVTFENVRCVPDFGYTLLLVKQLWREQKINSLFADDQCLVLENGDRLPYDHGTELPTVRIICASKLLATIPTRDGTALPAVATPATAVRPPPTPRRPRHRLPSPSLAPVPPAAAATPIQLIAEPTRGDASGIPDPIAPLTTEDSVEAAMPAPRASSGVSTRVLGFHPIGSTSHIARLPAAQAGDLLHRRSHGGVNKIRALAHTTSDGPKVLASVPATPDCTSCALARIKKASHSGTLDAPAPEPGELHFDIKEMVLSMGGYRYIVFLIDAHSRFVFYDFIKSKAEASSAVLRGMAAFDATVGTTLDDDGRPHPRPRARVLHSDREGGLISNAFREFRANAGLHHTTSAPHDDDLNPIAERIIGLISEMAAAIRIDSHAPARLWPWIIAYAVDWHNASITSVGSSTSNANISPFQRFTLRLPSVMDLASFGCRAVVLRPPTHQHKPSLSGRGWVGCFLGRSRHSKGSYDVLVDGRQIVTSSSVLVDKEHFDWAPKELRHRPLTSLTHAAAPPAAISLVPATMPLPPVTSNISGPSTFALLRNNFLNLFSGPYARADGLAAAMKSVGWEHILNIDNDGEKGGGWSHDLLSDAVFDGLMTKAHAGIFTTVMIAFPCSSASIARLFDATNNDGGDRGPPPIRDYDNPDGLPDHLIDPKHVRELRLSNQLLAIAARRSPSRATIIFENPSDRSPGASIASAPEFAKHGSIFRTTAFKRLIAEADLTGKATFAYCRLEPSGPPKYMTLYYTPEAGAVLDELNNPEFKCNHERGAHTKRAGGRDPATGAFISADAAAYPLPTLIDFATS